MVVQIIRAKFAHIVINVSTERLKRRPMLRQLRKSLLRRTMHVRVASDTQTIQSFDWTK